MTANLWKTFSFQVLTATGGTTLVQMLSYDGQLSRVRIDLASLLNPLNSNTGFETDTSGWTTNAATLARSTAQHHSGVASGLLTPDGSTGIARAIAPAAPVDASMSYTWSIWVYMPTAYSQVTADIDWLTSASAYISTSTGATTAISAGVWTQLTVTAAAPSNAAFASGKVSIRGTPTASNTLYADDATLVRSWPAGSTWTVQSSTDLARWTTVRGGTSITAAAGVVPLDDYEFVASVQNTYRVLVYSGATLVRTYQDSITPLLGVTGSDIWLKYVTAPFLNRVVTVADAGDTTRDGSNGVFKVIGRSLPVAVTDYAGSRTHDLVVATADAGDDTNTDLALSTGAVIFLHVPDGYPLDVQTGYYSVGQVTRTRRGLPAALNPMRWWTLPLTEVAAPAATVVGATTSWTAVVSTYATWSAVIAGQASWSSLLNTIANPADVIVG